MDYGTKNYMEQGGDKLVIGGALEIKEGAVVDGIPAPALAAASETALGGIMAAVKSAADTVEAKIGADNKLYVPAPPALPVAAAQADSAATDITGLVADFNALLAKLKAAGLMSP